MRNTEKKEIEEKQDSKVSITERKDFPDSINWNVDDSYELLTDNKKEIFKADSVEDAAITEEVVPVSEDYYEEADNKSEIVGNMVEPEEQERVVTKENYESMTDKEKAEWIGIDSNDMLVSIKQFHEKLKSIGITYQYISDETEEYCRLEEAIKKNSEPSWYYRNQDKRR